jgi:peptidyl-prolyl cis-trans isomerase C
MREFVATVCMVKTNPLNLLVVGCLVLAVQLVSPGGASAANDDGATVLISNSLAQVTRAEYDAELARLPPDRRVGFGNSPRRVNDLLTRMLMQKSLAANARNAKLDVAPENMLRIQLETDRLLGQFYIERIEAAAAAEFDATRSNYEARAREIYLVEKARFERPEQLMATHILFDTKKRSSDDAKALAAATRARVVAGADMSLLARELSDDPSAQNNNGKLDWFGRKEMDPAFASAAFALANPGDISEPVQSQFGWHVVRLDARRPAGVAPFDQVRETLMAELKKRFVDERREAAVAAIRRDPQTKIDSAAVDALTPKIDIEAAKRALGASPGAPSTTPAPAPR